MPAFSLQPAALQSAHLPLVELARGEASSPLSGNCDASRELAVLPLPTALLAPAPAPGSAMPAMDMGSTLTPQDEEGQDRDVMLPSSVQLAGTLSAARALANKNGPDGARKTELLPEAAAMPTPERAPKLQQARRSGKPALPVTQVGTADRAKVAGNGTEDASLAGLSLPAGSKAAGAAREGPAPASHPARGLRVVATGQDADVCVPQGCSTSPAVHHAGPLADQAGQPQLAPEISRDRLVDPPTREAPRKARSAAKSTAVDTSTARSGVSHPHTTVTPVPASEASPHNTAKASLAEQPSSLRDVHLAGVAETKRARPHLQRPQKESMPGGSSVEQARHGVESRKFQRTSTHETRALGPSKLSASGKGGVPTPRERSPEPAAKLPSRVIQLRAKRDKSPNSSTRGRSRRVATGSRDSNVLSGSRDHSRDRAHIERKRERSQERHRSVDRERKRSRGREQTLRRTSVQRALDRSGLRPEAERALQNASTGNRRHLPLNRSRSPRRRLSPTRRQSRCGTASSHGPVCFGVSGWSLSNESKQI